MGKPEKSRKRKYSSDSSDSEDFSSDNNKKTKKQPSKKQQSKNSSVKKIKSEEEKEEEVEVEEIIDDPGDFSVEGKTNEGNAENEDKIIEANKEDTAEVEVEEEKESVPLDPIVYLQWLTKICIYVFKLSQEDRGKTNKNYMNPIMQMMLNFKKVVEHPSADYDDFIEQFFDVYQENSKSILDDEDRWLTEKEIVIKAPFYVDKKKNIVRKKKNQNVARVQTASLYLSTVYNMAVEMSNKHANDKFAPGAKRNEYLYYPTRIIRAIYLLFTESIDSGKHLARLGELMDLADEQLGIVDRSIEENYEIKNDFMSSFFKGGFKQVLSLIINSMTKKGKIPEMKDKDGSPINLEKIVELIEGLFMGKDCEGFQKTFMEDLITKGRKDPGNLPKLILEALENEEFLNYISKFTGQDMDKSSITKILKEKSHEINNIFSQTMGKAEECGFFKKNEEGEENEEGEQNNEEIINNKMNNENKKIDDAKNNHEDLNNQLNKLKNLSEDVMDQDTMEKLEGIFENFMTIKEDKLGKVEEEKETVNVIVETYSTPNEEEILKNNKFIGRNNPFVSKTVKLSEMVNEIEMVSESEMISGSGMVSESGRVNETVNESETVSESGMLSETVSETVNENETVSESGMVSETVSETVNENETVSESGMVSETADINKLHNTTETASLDEQFSNINQISSFYDSLVTENTLTEENSLNV
jgi:hypothetical protein